MNNHHIYTSSHHHIGLLALSGMLLLMTVFATDASLAKGIVMGKVFWFHGAMVAFSVVSLLFIITFSHHHIPTLTSPDLLAVIFLVITLLTYNYGLNPEPEKLLFGGQLVVLWFLLRVVFKGVPSLKGFFLFFIVLAAGIEAFRGLEQLYGYRASAHHLFRLTGSFFNPGPYSGYLAVALPVALAFILRTRKLRRREWWHFTSVLYYVSWAALVLIVLVLPAGMSRSAWLAAGISGGCVYLKIYGFEDFKISRFLPPNLQILKSSNFQILKYFLFFAVITALLIGFYFLKKDSADGRLLMWKVSARAIISPPSGGWGTGVGIGCFPSAYAGEQAAYFASGKASAGEKMVAGCPEYAFNEYLQVGVEQGVPGLVCFLSFLMFSFCYGVRNRRFGAAGGLLALAVFAFSSYPLQLPSFWVLLVFLSAICVAEPCSKAPSKRPGFRINPVLTCVAATAISIALCYFQRQYYPAYKEWPALTMLYNNKAFEAATPGYRKLHPLLAHRPEFLFEYAQCLGKNGQHPEAKELLKRASRLSSDPMILYMIAKNAQELGNYREAEKHLQYGIDILPERIYPYYLLSKLYAAPTFYNPAKLQAAIDSVLTKEPKVHTTAIREMREEVRKIRGTW